MNKVPGNLTPKKEMIKEPTLRNMPSFLLSLRKMGHFVLYTSEKNGKITGCRLTYPPQRLLW